MTRNNKIQVMSIIDVAGALRFCVSLEYEGTLIVFLSSSYYRHVLHEYFWGNIDRWS